LYEDAAMPEFLENVGKYWHETKRRYNWQFITASEELNFIQTIAESIAPTSDPTSITNAIKHGYNRLIYDTIVFAIHNPDDPVARSAANRACAEIWCIARNIAIARGVDQADIEDIAQEVTLRLITNPEKVEKPHKLAAWIGYQVLDFRKRFYSGKLRSQQVALETAETAASTIDVEALVERHLMLTLFKPLLKEVLSNAQYVIICKHLIDGSPPHEVAQQLNVDPHTIHSQKYRALKIIRNHPKLRELLESIHEQQ